MKTAHVVTWKSPAMSAPSFFYYKDRGRATRAYKAFLADGCTAEPPRKQDVPDHTPFMDDLTVVDR